MNNYKRHRFKPDIISYAFWFYCRFNPSHRDFEYLLADRGSTAALDNRWARWQRPSAFNYEFPDKPLFLFIKLFDGVRHKRGTGSIHSFRHANDPFERFSIQSN